MGNLLRPCFLPLLLVFLAGLSSCYQPITQPPTAQGLANNITRRPLSEAELDKMTKNEILSYLKGQAENSVTPTNDIVDMRKSLSFRVCNKTDLPFYCCCFYYMKNKLVGRWRWDKSKVYKIKPKATRLIVLDETIDDDRERKSVFGYLGIFKDKKEASDAVMEIVDETMLLDLDLLHKIKDKVVEVNVKKYGIKGEMLGYDAESDKKKPLAQQKLDILIANETGQDIFLTCFVYEQPEKSYRYDLWRYDKTDVQKILAGSTTLLNIPGASDKYRLNYMRGTLGVFDASSKALAEKATFELTEPANKVELGLLVNLKGKKISLGIENYGVMGDFIDYTIRPAAFVNKHREKLAKKA